MNRSRKSSREGIGDEEQVNMPSILVAERETDARGDSRVTFPDD